MNIRSSKSNRVHAVTRPGSNRRMVLSLIPVLMITFACSGTRGSWHDAPDIRVAATAVGPSTASRPSIPWTAPSDAVPHDPTTPVESTTILESGHTLSLTEIIDAALTNNPSTRTAWLDARAAEAALGSARSAYLPEIGLTVNLNRSTGAAGSASLGPTTQTRFSPSISLSYLLFDFGGRDAMVEQARQRLIAADYLHNQAIQDVILRAQQSYYDYLDAKALLHAQDATIEERKKALDVADGRHSAGVANIGDVLQARTALLQARLTYETLEGRMRTLEGLMLTVMGVPPQSAFQAGDLPSDVPSNEIMDHVEQFMKLAASSRPELAAQRANAQRAEARVRAVRAEGLPRISLDGSGGGSAAAGNGNRVVYPRSAGVSLRVPLFTGGRNAYDVREARLSAEIAAENVRRTQQQIDLQVWTSYYELQTATRRTVMSRELLIDARQSVEVASGRYKAGVGTILDVLTAQAALENARALEVQARADWFVSVAQLAHDTGTLMTDSGETK